MVSVAGVSGVGALAQTGAGAARAQGGFRLPASAAAANAGVVSSMAELGGMLGLQEQEDGAARDRGARRHGQASLRELAALQRSLLAGPGDPEALQRLTALGRATPEFSDPGLSSVVKAIALRAAIELARRGL
jgi:hypothetical protein